MKITTANGVLLISDKTQVDVNIVNPVFNERGSHSLPFSVPWCDHNLSVLGHPERHTNAKRVAKNIECSIEIDKYNESGVLTIIEISAGQPIELAYLTREGQFWEWAKKKNLRSITIPHSEMDITIENFNTTLQEYIDNVWPDVDFAFFPVATNFIALNNYDNPGSYNTWSDRKLCISDYILWNNPGDLWRNDGDDRSSAISPFVYLNAAIQWIAQEYGFSVNENFLASTEELRSAVILNKEYNTSLVGGYSVFFNRLLPNTSIMDFITGVETLFDCIFFANSRTKTINIRHKGQIFESIAKPINGNVAVKEYTERKSLKFSFEKPSSPYNTVDERAIDNDLFNYDTEAGIIIEGKIYHSAATPDYVNYPHKVVFSKALQCYFYYSWIQGSPNWEYKATCIHSNYFERHVNSSLEEEKIEVKAQIVPMVPVNCRQFYKNSGSNAYFDFSLIVPFFPQWDWLFRFENGILGNDDADTPLSIAFNRGRIATVTFGTTLFGVSSFNLPFGSVDVYTKDGDKIETASIALRFAGNYNIYESLFKELEKFYNDCNAVVEIYNTDANEILFHDFFDKFLCDGNSLLFDELDLSLSINNITINSILARSLSPKSN